MDSFTKVDFVYFASKLHQHPKGWWKSGEASGGVDASAELRPLKALVA